MENEEAQDSTQPSGSGRFLKIFCPVVLLLGLLCVGCGFGFTFFLASAMKSGEPYTGALEKARADVRVVEALGTPIEDGFMPSGNVSINNASGSATLTIGVSGPKGPGTIHVNATMSAGQWNYDTLVVEAGGSRIDLLGSSEGD